MLMLTNKLVGSSRRNSPSRNGVVTASTSQRPTRISWKDTVGRSPTAMAAGLAVMSTRIPSVLVVSLRMVRPLKPPRRSAGSLPWTRTMTACWVWRLVRLILVSVTSALAYITTRISMYSNTNTCTVKPRPQATFFDTVKSDLDSPLFAVSLKHHAAGSYDFGYIDKSKFTGSLKYADVDSSEGFWMFTAEGYGVGDGKANSEPIRGIIGKKHCLCRRFKPMY